MGDVVICLRLHVPLVLREYSIFDSDQVYFDRYRTREVFRNWASSCVLPTNRLLASLLRHFPHRFRFAVCISGVSINGLREYAPEAYHSFRELARSGAVEFLATTHHQTLAFLYSPEEFRRQIEMHREAVHELTSQTPTVFCNPELAASIELGPRLNDLGMRAILAEERRSASASRNPDESGDAVASTPVPPPASRMASLLVLHRRRRLSQDLALRFADREWDQWPLTAPKYADWVTQASEEASPVMLWWDYGCFGWTYGRDSGVHDFLRFLPEKLLAKQLALCTPSMALDRLVGELPAFPADHGYSLLEEAGGDISAWVGNPLQSDALQQLFAMSARMNECAERQIVEDWRALQSVDYLRCMNPGYMKTVSRHRALAYLPDSAYDAYINYMNVCDSLALRVREVSWRESLRGTPS